MAAIDRIAAEREWSRLVSHELAQMITIGMHKPASLPDYEPLHPVRKAEAAPKSDEADQAYVRAYLTGLAMRGEQQT